MAGDVQFHNPADEALYQAVLTRRAKRAETSPVPPLDRPAPPAVEPLYDGYHESAAVLGWYEPKTLQPTTPADPGGLDRLVAGSVAATDNHGQRRLSIGADLRVAVLRQLRERDAVPAALAANPAEAGDVLYRVMREQLTGKAAPLEDMALEGLHSLALVSGWLRAAGFPDLPDEEALNRRIAWLTLLAPFELLVGDHFRGRAAELARLRAYVGVLSPGSAEGPATVRSSAPQEDLLPLVISGPGGVGKSTLLARFILDHARALERDRFPFVYLDFDRPGVDGAEPLTLLIEALNQLAVEYPEVGPRLAPIREGWLRLLQGSDPPDRARRSAAADFGSLLHSVGASGRPVLFVLDTFEEVQWRSLEHVDTIWDTLREIHRGAPQLRVVIAGRGEITGHPVQPMALAGLDPEAAIGFLLAHGVADAALAERVAAEVGGDPQNLELAARTYHAEGPAALEGLLGPGLIRQKLYNRVLDHVHEEDVRRLAHPGLVLRRLTPELILEVLAEPCDLGISTPAEAQRLFDELGRETALVTFDVDGALIHRPDLRRTILALLEADEPEKARQIHAAAVAHYEPGPGDPVDRAEEIYHRLKLGLDRDVCLARWVPGVGPRLINAVDELDPAPSAFLAAQLGLAVTDRVRAAAALEDWERLVAARARTLLDNGEVEAALGLLTERPGRTPESAVVELEAEALYRLDRIDDALVVLDHGVDVAGDNLSTARPLALLAAEIMVVGQKPSWSSLVLKRMDQWADASPDPVRRLTAAAVRRAIQGALSVEVAGRIEFEDAFDAVSDDALTAERTLAALCAALFRTRVDIPRLRRVISLIGLPRHDPSTVRRLAAAIADFDRGLSNEVAQFIGVPSRKTGTEAWSEYLLDATDAVAQTAIDRLLDRYQRTLPDRLVAAIGDVLLTELRPYRWYPAITTSGSGTSPGDDPLPQYDPPLEAPPGEQLITTLTRSLTAVFSLETLRWFLRLRMDLSLDSLVEVSGSSWPTTVEQLVRELERRGRLAEFVARAREVAPGDEGLLQVSEQIGLSTLSSPADALEDVVRRESSLDAQDWRDRLGEIDGQVGLLSLVNGAKGTGFLVAADLVLTAYHVLGKDQAASGGQIQFDYKSLADGRTVTAGTEFRLGSVLAADADLDFALITVPDTPGVLPVGGYELESSARPRGWVQVPHREATPEVGSGLVMAHHPQAGPLQLTTASDAVAGLSEDGRYLYHRLSTEPGSAGAPIFGSDLELVAIHLGWKPDAPVAKGANYALRLVEVQRELGRLGLGHRLGSALA